MAIDPALKGTTFGAALEAAEAAEAARRAARAQETSAKEAETAAIRRRAEMERQRYTSHQRGRPETPMPEGLVDEVPDLPKPSLPLSSVLQKDLAIAIELSANQVRALAAGIRALDDGAFDMPPGHKVGPLLEAGLLIRLRDGTYQITVKGQCVYAAHWKLCLHRVAQRAAQEADKESLMGRRA